MEPVAHATSGRSTSDRMFARVLECAPSLTPSLSSFPDSFLLSTGWQLYVREAVVLSGCNTRVQGGQQPQCMELTQVEQGRTILTRKVFHTTHDPISVFISIEERSDLAAELYNSTCLLDNSPFIRLNSCS